MNDQQYVFLRHYIKTLNIRQAAAYAGIPTTTAWELLQKDEVQDIIDTEMIKVSARNTINVQRLIAEISAIANCNIMDYFDVQHGTNITFRDLNELPEPIQKCIKSIDATVMPDGECVKLKLKLHDKLGALQQLCKVFGLEMERVLLTVDDSGAALLQGENTGALPAPNSVAEWEAQVIDARRARLAMPVSNIVAQPGSGALNSVNSVPGGPTPSRAHADD